MAADFEPERGRKAASLEPLRFLSLCEHPGPLAVEELGSLGIMGRRRGCQGRRSTSTRPNRPGEYLRVVQRSHRECGGLEGRRGKLLWVGVGGDAVEGEPGEQSLSSRQGPLC